MDATPDNDSIILLIGINRSRVNPIPKPPERSPMIRVSALKILEMFRLEAPILLKIPISFVLSRTEIKVITLCLAVV